jgi:hypothetical protein
MYSNSAVGRSSQKTDEVLARERRLRDFRCVYFSATMPCDIGGSRTHTPCGTGSHVLRTGSRS